MASIFLRDVDMVRRHYLTGAAAIQATGAHLRPVKRLGFEREVGVTSRVLQRIAVVTVALGLALSATALRAPAALDMALGDRKVVDNQPVSACDASAKAALTQVVNNATEIGSSSQWVGAAPATGPDGTVATAVIHCIGTGGGYVVTFTCATQVPPNPDSASALCAKLSAAFGAK